MGPLLESVTLKMDHRTLPLANLMWYDRYQPMATMTPTLSHSLDFGSRTRTAVPTESGPNGRACSS